MMKCAWRGGHSQKSAHKIFVVVIIGVDVDVGGSI